MLRGRESGRRGGAEDVLASAEEDACGKTILRPLIEVVSIWIHPRNTSGRPRGGRGDGIEYGVVGETLRHPMPASVVIKIRIADPHTSRRGNVLLQEGILSSIVHTEHAITHRGTFAVAPAPSTR